MLREEVLERKRVCGGVRVLVRGSVNNNINSIHFICAMAVVGHCCGQVELKPAAVRPQQQPEGFKCDVFVQAQSDDLRAKESRL